MKKLFLFILFFSPVLILAQTLSHTGVVSTKDTTITKDELYSRGVLWVSETFKSPGDVLKMSDKDNGIIQGTGSMYYNSSYQNYASGYITFNFKLFLKKSKYKYEFSDFNHKGYNEAWSYGFVNDGECNRGVFWNKYYIDIKSSINSRVTSMLKSLEITMNKGINNDW